MIQRSRESVWLFVPTSPVELLNSSLHSHYFSHAKHTFWWYESLFFAVKTRLDRRTLHFKDVLFHAEDGQGHVVPDNQVVSGLSVWAYVTAPDGEVLQVTPLGLSSSTYTLSFSSKTHTFPPSHLLHPFSSSTPLPYCTPTFLYLSYPSLPYPNLPYPTLPCPLQEYAWNFADEILLGNLAVDTGSHYSQQHKDTTTGPLIYIPD